MIDPSYDSFQQSNDDQNNNPSSEWNFKLEKSIQSLGELSLGYKWMHCEMAKEYTIIYDRLMYSSIALGPTVGVINTINLYAGDIMIIPILITILSFMTGVLAGIIKFCDYEVKITNHKSIAAKYTSLANNARIQLNLERPDREDPKQYIIWYTTSYGNLFEASPILHDNIILKWKLHAQKHGFKIPGEVGILFDEDTTHRDDINKKQFADLKNILTGEKNVNTVQNSRPNVRLKLYDLDKTRNTDFKKDDLDHFNNLIMKRKIRTQLDSARPSNHSTPSSHRPQDSPLHNNNSLSWRDNLPSDTSQSSDSDNFSIV